MHGNHTWISLAHPTIMFKAYPWTHHWHAPTGIVLRTIPMPGIANNLSRVDRLVGVSRQPDEGMVYPVTYTHVDPYRPCTYTTL